MDMVKQSCLGHIKIISLNLAIGRSVVVGIAVVCRLGVPPSAEGVPLISVRRSKADASV